MSIKQNFVAIENAANSSSVALLQIAEDGVTTVSGRQHEAAQQHAEHILPMLDSLLDEAQLAKGDIHGVVFSQGPGAFTGLRIACGVAQGLALGLDVDVVAVDSLRASASMVPNKQDYDLLVSVLDARMQEVYLAVYQPSAVTIQEPVLIAVEDVLPWLVSQVQGWQETYGLTASSATINVLLCGNALGEYAQVFQQGIADLGSNEQALGQNAQALGVSFHLGSSEWPNAEVLVRLGYEEFKQGRAMAAELAAPLYLRDKVAFTTAERERGMGGNPKASLPVSKEQSAQGQAAQRMQLLTQALAQHQSRLEIMQKADIEAVVQIEQQVQADPWTAGMFADCLEANYKAWVLRHENGQVMAYALQMFAPDVAHLLTIAVAPEWQQQGLGRILLDWTELQVLEAYLTAQMLEVRVSNAAARALYQAQDYQQIGLRKGYYKGVNGQSEDALVLQKNLL